MASVSGPVQPLPEVFGQTVSSLMYHYFSAMAGRNDRVSALLCEMACAESLEGFEGEACREFKTWFKKIKLGGHHFEEFERLFSSQDFSRLCYSLYYGSLRIPDHEPELCLVSSDEEIFMMPKSVATAESVVLKDLVDSTGSRGEIPLDVSGDVLSEIIDFCQKKQDFSKVLETLLGHYKGWVTGFLTSNQAILHDLHTGADFLHIPGLLTLTTPAMTDLGGNAVEGISEWCGNLSLSRLLTSMWVRVGEDDPLLGGNRPLLLIEEGFPN